jgi:hypothetical protein
MNSHLLWDEQFSSSHAEKNYVLFLEQDKIYVGYTAKPFKHRWKKHISGKGALWTTEYPVIYAERIVTGDKKRENLITLIYMNIYGWQNVRGGVWFNPDMNNPPVELTLFQSYDKCDKLCDAFIQRDYDTFEILVADLKIQLTISQTNIEDSDDSNDDIIQCYRCGREEHYTYECDYKTNVSGRYIKNF